MDKEDFIHIYNGILLSHKKNKFLPFATIWIDLEGIIFSEVSQREKDKYCILSVICEIKKIKQMNITKEKQVHRYGEQTSGYQWAEERGRAEY